MHTVQFYESEVFLHRAVERFLGPAVTHGAPAAMIARPRTFEAVVERMASERGLSAAEASRGIRFVDVDTAHHGFMDGDMPDPARVERGFSSLVDGLRQGGANGPILIYGELVDALCQEGRHRAAIRIEELWNGLFAGRDISVLCGYAIDAFDDVEDPSQLRQVCRQHTHVIPTEAFTDPPADRTTAEQIALRQHRARAHDRSRVTGPVGAGSATTAPILYVVDDDAGVRRSLARLLSAAGFRVETYASAEAFLADVSPAANGCLILDIELPGMKGHDLQRRLARERRSMPVIAMSALLDQQVGREALRLGAVAFLRKPFDAQALFDAIKRVRRA